MYKEVIYLNNNTAKTNSNKNRILYYDILNILASIGVVFLHCNGLVHTFSNSLGWYQALIIEVCFYWPVPVFFMLSGATLMGYRDRYSTKEFLTKRFSRTVIPFIVWTIVSAIIKNINPLEIGIREFINQFINVSIENVYWFFIPLFSIYLSMPALSLLKDHRNTLWYLAGASFLLTSLLPSLFNYVGLSWNNNFNVTVINGYVMFVIIGYLLSNEDFTRKKRILIYVLGIIGAVLRYSMTIYLSLRDQTLNRTFFGYTQYHSVFLAVAVFVFVKNSKLIDKLKYNKKASSIITKISGCSFGVYLVHMIVIRFLNEILPDFVGVEWRLIGPFIVYSLSLIITCILRKIPFVKRVIP